MSAFPLSVVIEERPVFGAFAGLLSYQVNLTYCDAGNWDWQDFALVSEVERAGLLVYRATPLDEAFSRPVIQAGIRALIVADLADPNVMDIIQEAIVADMRDRDDDAREYAAELRHDDVRQVA